MGRGEATHSPNPLRGAGCRLRHAGNQVTQGEKKRQGSGKLVTKDAWHPKKADIFPIDRGNL
jgi:hypothetical protein